MLYLEAMLKKELKSHYFVTLAWLAVIVVLRLAFSFRVFFELITFLNWLVFCLGALMGTMLIDIDQLISAWFFYPESPTAGRIKQLLKQKDIKGILLLLADTYQERTKLPFHGALFQVIFVVFSFWVLTSTGNWLGKGLVMAVNLHLLKDEIHLWRLKKEDSIRPWLFWQIKRQVSIREQKVFIVVMLMLFLGLNLLLI